MKKKISISFLIILFISVIFISYNNVDVSVTDEDIVYIQKIIGSNQLDTFAINSYEDEIAIIKMVQNKVLTIAPQNKGIPHNMNREPKDIFGYKYGLCYDRSRVIEKALKIFGFETRHIAAYAPNKGEVSLLPNIINTKAQSHAFSEVKTSKGWIFVDSNNIFIGLNDMDEPISIDFLKNKRFNSINWSSYNNMNYKVIYRIESFTFLYGLYSRHGYFYPPYNFIPDINWSEFSYNF